MASAYVDEDSDRDSDSQRRSCSGRRRFRTRHGLYRPRYRKKEITDDRGDDDNEHFTVPSLEFSNRKLISLSSRGQERSDSRGRWVKDDNVREKYRQRGDYGGPARNSEYFSPVFRSGNLSAEFDISRSEEATVTDDFGFNWRGQYNRRQNRSKNISSFRHGYEMTKHSHRGRGHNGRGRTRGRKFFTSPSITKETSATFSWREEMTDTGKL